LRERVEKSKVISTRDEGREGMVEEREREELNIFLVFLSLQN
jgi:hypothetical protein